MTLRQEEIFTDFSKQKRDFWSNKANEDLFDAKRFYTNKLKPALQEISFTYPRIFRSYAEKISIIGSDFEDILKISNDVKFRLLKNIKEFGAIAELFEKIDSDKVESLHKTLMRYIDKFNISYKCL